MRTVMLPLPAMHHSLDSVCEQCTSTNLPALLIAMAGLMPSS